MESLLISGDYSNMYVIVESECSSRSVANEVRVSFHIKEDGKVESFPGVDLHDSKYNDLGQSEDLVDLAIDPDTIPDGLCVPKVGIESFVESV